jgi:hypothetical protein
MTASHPKLVRRPAAAERLAEKGLPTSRHMLAKLAVEGTGPPFHKWGRVVLYPINELDRWAEARLSALRTSTKGAA